MDPVTYKEVTFPRYGSIYPWPLNYILTWQKRRQVIKRLTALGWANKSIEDVRIFVLKNIFRKLSDIGIGGNTLLLF
jgi:metaxin